MTKIVDTTFRKNTRFATGAIFMLAAIVASATVLSCVVPAMPSTNGGGASCTLVVNVAQPDTGNVTAQAAARTVVPGVAVSAAKYVVAYNSTAATGSIEIDPAGTLTTNTIPNLPPGSYTVTVSAYNHATSRTATNLIATGTVTGINLTEGGITPAYVQLKPIQTTPTGKGDISLTIKWPTTSASSISWTIDGIPQSAPTITGSGSLNTSTLATSGLALTSGVHAVRINFMSGTSITGSQLEIVNVYDNMTSDMFVGADGSLSPWREYSADEVMDGAKSLTTGVTVRVIAGSDSPSPFLLTSGSPTATYTAASVNTITIIPTVNVPGENIAYTWTDSNASVASNPAATSDAPITFTVPTIRDIDGAVSRTNTLSITVKSPNSASSFIYTLTIRSPIHVTTPTGLASALSVLDNNVVLDGPLDLTTYGTWNHVGTEAAPFIGTLEGNGYTINKMTTDVSIIDGTTPNPLTGMFGCLGVGGIIKNIHLTELSVPNGTNAHKGGLVSYNKGTILRCSTSGTVAGDVRVGGLVGRNDGTVSECWSNAAVTGTYIGGLVGENYGTIENSYARGVVTAHWGGGLLGSNAGSGIVRNCYATSSMIEDGNVSGNTGEGYFQGLIGNSTGTITNSYYDSSKIINSYSAGSVINSGYFGTPLTTAQMKDSANTATNYSSSWSFSSIWKYTTGKNGGYPHLFNNTPTVDISVASQTDLEKITTNLNGDFTLSSNITISTWIPNASSAFTGTFDGNNNTISGLMISGRPETYQGLFGLIGVGGVVKNLKLANVNIENTGNSNLYHTGAIASTSEGLISNCSVESGTVSGAYHTGGLVGVNSGIVEYCYSKAVVKGTGLGSMIGGLAGTNFKTIRYSYATGSVSGLIHVGGFVGLNKGSAAYINDCYARGTILGLTGASTGNIGGFVGSVEGNGNVVNCFSRGLVTGLSSPIGGFAGAVSGTIGNCFYDVQSSAQNDTGKGTRTPTATMKAGNYAGWAFGTIWTTNAHKNNGYPCLSALLPADDIWITGGAQNAATLSGQLNAKLDGNYVLQGNITLSGIWTPVGQDTNTFTGTFDGGKYTVSGMNTNAGSDANGFFGAVGTGGVVENLTVRNFTLSGTGGGNAGLVGINYGTVSHCAAAGSATFAGSSYIGGITGRNLGVLSQCYSTVRVASAAQWYIGGMAGGNEGDIANCYAQGQVSSNSSAGQGTGGLVGWNVSGARIYRSYALGNVSGYQNVGGFVGTQAGYISNSFSAGAASGTGGNVYPFASGGTIIDSTNMTITQMRNISTFPNWDIVSTSSTANAWGIDSSINNGYPYLQYFGADTLLPEIILAGMYNGTDAKTFTYTDVSLTETNHLGTANSAYKTTTTSNIKTSDSDLIFGSSNAYTICGWFKIDDYTNGGTLFYRGGNSGSLNYGTGVNTSGQIQAQISKSGDTGSTITTPNYTLPAGWFHVAFVHTTTPTNKIELYINGSSVGSSSAFTYSAAAAGSFYFGAFNGAMSDLKIYNSALSSGTIATVMATP